MHIIKTAVLFASVAAAHFPCPGPGAIEAKTTLDGKFSLINNYETDDPKVVTASNGLLFLGGEQKGASCDPPGSKVATFYLKDGAVYLYTGSATPQQLWVDKSGPDKGLLGYTTGAQPLPPNAKHGGFAISTCNDFVHDGLFSVACPTADGGSTILFKRDVYFEDPPPGCVKAYLHLIPEDKPVACEYSSS